MTTSQLIALLFPVLAGGAAVTAGYAALRWIAPQPGERLAPENVGLDVRTIEESETLSTKLSKAAESLSGVWREPRLASAHTSRNEALTAPLHRARLALQAAEREIEQVSIEMEQSSRK
ncbi:hypothetical protein ACQR16_08260 [Bradyrhizobium oligotrophicum]|uniref:hypothetical protein n=1 Tax=Bradyrhizobium oligotrophicum TaxID=44255 RepID=UPI003EB6CC46